MKAESSRPPSSARPSAAEAVGAVPCRLVASWTRRVPSTARTEISEDSESVRRTSSERAADAEEAKT